MKKQTGFTLIELIITVAIVAILAAIAVPNFGTMLRNSELKGTYNSFAGTLATARTEAISRRTPITVCPSTNGTTCVGNGADWSAGYIAFADSDRDNTVDADEEVLRYEQVPAKVSIVSSANQYQKSITFVARGRLPSVATFTFCVGEDDKTAKALNLWVTGLGRLATDSDNDSIVEGIDGDAVSCS